MNCPQCKMANRPGAANCRRCQVALPPTCAGCDAPVAAGEELCSACRTARVLLSAGVGEGMPAARSVEVAHLLAELLGYPFPESPIVEPLAESPKQLEARMFIAARRFLAADARRGPLMLLLDDVERAS